MADIILVLIVVFCTYLGKKKGLIRTVFNTVSYIASIILAAIIYRPIKAIVLNSFVADKINTSVNLKISGVMQSGTEELPDFLKGIVGKSAENFASALADTLTSAAVFIICVVLIFVVIKIFLAFSDKITKIIKKLPLIGGCDRLLGTVFGFVNGILIVDIVLFLGTLILTGEPYKIFMSAVNSSYITKFFYDNNLLMALVVKYL